MLGALPAAGVRSYNARMRKLTLSEWAQAGELIAAVAVVISLRVVSSITLERMMASPSGEVCTIESG